MVAMGRDRVPRHRAASKRDATEGAYGMLQKNRYATPVPHLLAKKFFKPNLPMFREEHSGRAGGRRPLGVWYGMSGRPEYYYMYLDFPLLLAYCVVFVPSSLVF